jgi:hypothetical protein
MPITLSRRKFVGALGGAAAWPLAANAQQSKVPTVAVLVPGTQQAFQAWITALVRRLAVSVEPAGRSF